MKSYLSILLVAIIANAAYAQTETPSPKIRKSNIRFGIGMTHVRMIDQGYTDSRLLFRGTNTKLSLAYGRETERYIFGFSIDGAIGKVESKSGGLPSNYYFLKPSLEWLKPITGYTLFGKESKFFLGATLNSINQGVESERVIDNISIFSLHGIYLNFFNRLKLNEKHSFQMSYSMPVVVFENRTLWNGGASKYTYSEADNFSTLFAGNGEFTYFNLFNNIQLGVDYVLKTGKATSLSVGYNFLFVNNLIEAPLRLYSNDLILELKISL